jgi:hypothetical protein
VYISNNLLSHITLNVTGCFLYIYCHTSFQYPQQCVPNIACVPSLPFHHVITDSKETDNITARCYYHLVQRRNGMDTHTHTKPFRLHLFVLPSISTCTKIETTDKHMHTIQHKDRYMYHAHPISDNLTSLSSGCPVCSIPQVHMYRICVKKQLKIHFFWDGALLGEQISMSQRTVVPSSSERSSPKNFG